MLSGVDLSIVPPRVGVAVSGGADSVALLRMIIAARNEALNEASNPTRSASDIVVIHFNHQLRDQASDEDEAFVRALCDSLGIARFIVAAKDLIQRHTTEVDWPTNPSAKYRAMRHAVYQHATREHALDAVALAHHADDQAETVALRLLRGTSLTSLGAMRPMALHAGVWICRPMLGARRDALRTYLKSIHQPWREDASNASNAYRRNVVRKYLSAHSTLCEKLCALANASHKLKDAVEARAPKLAEAFERKQLQQLDPTTAECAARRWLVARGCPADDVSPRTCGRLIKLATNVSAPARAHFPGGVDVRRRARLVFVDSVA